MLTVNQWLSLLRPEERSLLLNCFIWFCYFIITFVLMKAHLLLAIFLKKCLIPLIYKLHNQVSLAAVMIRWLLGLTVCGGYHACK